MNENSRYTVCYYRLFPVCGIGSFSKKIFSLIREEKSTWSRYISVQKKRRYNLIEKI